MTAALAFLFSPLHAAMNFFHWEMFNDAADELWRSHDPRIEAAS